VDAHLTDLDAIILRVRERKSREYIAEAVAAYRVGAYKAAVIGTWIAVTFDILMKIRELAQSGDGAAGAFIRDFDKASENNNLERLSKLEGELLSKALDPFAFIGPLEHAQLTRLKADRNVCAHPAFSSDAQLFSPQPELVRLHIVTAVEALLAAAPVQGKAMITEFAADLASPAFPRDGEQAARYVGERYLSRLRPGALDSFAAVLFKGYLREDVPGWAGLSQSVLHALAAIRRYHSDVWARDVLPIALRLIGEASGDQLGRAFPLIRAFPDLRDRLDEPSLIRLRALIDNYDPLRESNDEVFAAADLEGFADLVSAVFSRLDEDKKAQVISRFPNRAFIADGVQQLRDAGSYRGAEAAFRRAVTPLAGVMTARDLALVAAAVEENGEVWNASGIPKLLGDLLERIPDHVRLEAAPWVSLKTFLESRSASERFSCVWEVLSRRGLGV
jgi:hypothetical protein